jgi:hypothetical protein
MCRDARVHTSTEERPTGASAGRSADSSARFRSHQLPPSMSQRAAAGRASKRDLFTAPPAVNLNRPRL